MQARAIETPKRPRPPAKVRRSLAKGSTTPPPAYASTCLFPVNGDAVDSAGGKWSEGIAFGDGNNSESPDDDLAWLAEKSRDELTELLVKADTLIKERESELSITSAACKSLYENNVALKTKHEALINKIPLSPPSLNAASAMSREPSPGLLGSPPRPAFSSLSRSTSEFGLGSSPEQMLSKSYSYNSRRGVSVPTALDISFLADQNAELLSKLEKLESEATSTDLVGRRELRRLEKEIGVLKEELEKTQARSDELEEKAKTGFGLGAKKVIEEVWKKKKEREARIMATKNMKPVRDGGESSTVRNFAPDAPSLFRGTVMRQYSGPELSILEEASQFDEDILDIPESKPSSQLDHQLVAKLLDKIQELETTNSKILEHQTETATRLQAVQRETEFMTKVYERLHELNHPHDEDEIEARDQVPDGLVNRVSGSHRILQAQLLAAKVKRQRSYYKHESRTRGTVIGLFDEPAAESSTPLKTKDLPVPFNEGSWNRPRHQSSYSIGSGGLVSPALSILSLYSPPRQLVAELSPGDFTGPSLANELGDQWDKSDSTSRLRARSLSELSILSASPSPYPSTSELCALSTRQRTTQDHTLPTSPGPSNSLQLSIEPPTPQIGTPVPPTQNQEAMLIGNMSPRFQVSRSLRTRNNFATEARHLGALVSNNQPQTQKQLTADNSFSTPPRNPPANRPSFVEAFEVMMDEFDGQHEGIQDKNKNMDNSRSPSPDAEEYADAKEELDECDREHAIPNIRVDAVAEGEKESYSEENSVSTTPQPGEISKLTLGKIVLELWMWLQFMIIMLVFLWAMARKGPKLVLRDAERKRTLSIKKKV